MGAVNLKGTVTVVQKQKRRPAGGLVTLLAVYLVLRSKLTAMDITMAINAPERQRTVTYKRALGIGVLLFRMTLPARHFPVSAHQGEASCVVIKFALVPALTQMADFATARSRASVELPGVYIPVANLAAAIGQSEK